MGCARASMGKKQGKNFNENAQNCRVRFRIAFFHHFLAFSRHFLTFVRWRTVSFFYSQVHFLIFSGPGRHQWQENCEQSPSTPHWSGQRTPLNIPRDMCLALLSSCALAHGTQKSIERRELLSLWQWLCLMRGHYVMVVFCFNFPCTILTFFGSIAGHAFSLQ